MGAHDLVKQSHMGLDPGKVKILKAINESYRVHPEPAVGPQTYYPTLWFAQDL